MTVSPLATLPSRLLRLVGLVAVVSAGGNTLLHHGWWAVAAVASWIGWVVWIVVPERPRWPTVLCLVAMAIGGGLTCSFSAGSAITALAAVFAGFALLDEPVAVGAVIAALAIFGASVSQWVAGDAPSSLLAVVSGALVMGLMGWTRRQSRIAAEQNRLLVEQNRVIRAERDRAAALTERGRIARDMHDVLAHTLGGLVLQLDAADALLEAGEVDRAAERVKASHRLAVSGLADARRVVGALRAEEVDLGAELQRLADDHRGSGGRVEVRIDADLRGLDEQTAVALSRAIQEALTNARKHAPGQPVSIDLRTGPQGLTAVVSNALGSRVAALARTGSGAGLLGMTERIAALGGSVTAGRVDGHWTVRIRVPAPGRPVAGS
ncbi:sensor histidine kinase [Nocardia sp. alder85J]|uniref:sensor histidine kinase n=1 Tax=Nocardia sp. alder85J TaxID=2862949 RepID=UPI001CD63706|nr:histidine kinase [Nocardia sp. alder85J]MCX4096009.1 histidine kinase [Nocardia sp. alder85J]